MLISIPCLIAPSGVVRLLGCSDVLLTHAISYLLWLLPGIAFLLIECVGMMLIRLDGSPKYAMLCIVVAASFNIVLAYILVFPMQMGVAGAAIATSVSCGLGGIMVLIYFLKYSTTLKFYRLKTSMTSLLLTIRNTWYSIKTYYGKYRSRIG